MSVFCSIAQNTTKSNLHFTFDHGKIQLSKLLYVFLRKENYMLLYIIIILISLAVRFFVSMAFLHLAEEKGHNGTPYFWSCLLLGTIGCCMVACLPDLRLYAEFADIKKLIRNQSAPQSPTTATLGQPSPSVAPNHSSSNSTTSTTWTCKNCGANNSTNYGQCKKCGKFRY